MAEETRHLNLRYSLLVQPRLEEIWLWNADRYGDRHATQFVDFLRQRTLRLGSDYGKGRPVPTRPSYRHMVLKKRARGHGYVVVYQVLENEVFIFDYFHTAMDWIAQLQSVTPKE
jgi:plasmid stabilization system protein ParE